MIFKIFCTRVILGAFHPHQCWLFQEFVYNRRGFARFCWRGLYNLKQIMWVIRNEGKERILYRKKWINRSPKEVIIFRHLGNFKSNPMKGSASVTVWKGSFSHKCDRPTTHRYVWIMSGSCTCECCLRILPQSPLHQFLFLYCFYFLF